MNVKVFLDIIGADFYTGVPDSQLKALCDYLLDAYGVNPKKHIIAANEGNCVGIAAGYHLATNKVPVVYMQNSGEGNIINPVASLLNDEVYGIPVVFVIGWRGEPGVHDEPQHIYQGKVTLQLLEDMDISYMIVDKQTSEESLMHIMAEYKNLLERGKSVAFVIKKDALNYEKKLINKNEYSISREEAIMHIVDIADKDPIISTTGKASRELYEIRERNKQEHKYDFLTVGSMGHSSSIALGVALNTEKKVWCIDGDGALLMHMGAMAVIGSNTPPNMIHIIINNGAHETVGGMPTVAGSIDFVAMAKACGYPNAVKVEDLEALDRELERAKIKNELSMIEVMCAIGARDDLGRPTKAPIENKENFIEYLREL